MLFSGPGFQIWIGQVKPSSHIYGSSNAFLKSFFAPQPCLKAKNRSCVRGFGFDSEVVSANPEGGK